MPDRIDVVKLRPCSSEKNASLVMTIPKDLLEGLDWEKGTRVVIEKVGKSLLVKSEKDYMMAKSGIR